MLISGTSFGKEAAGLAADTQGSWTNQEIPLQFGRLIYMYTYYLDLVPVSRNICLYLYVHKHVNMYMHVQIHIYAYMYMHMQIHIYTYMYIQPLHI